LQLADAKRPRLLSVIACMQQRRAYSQPVTLFFAARGRWNVASSLKHKQTTLFKIKHCHSILLQCGTNFYQQFVCYCFIST